MGKKQANHTLQAVAPVYILVSAAIPALIADPYVRESALAVNLLLIYVLSWDLYCGPTRQTNFGHSFFVGGGAYLSAILATRAGLSPWLSAGLAVAGALAVGAFVGWLTARSRGPTFALATMALQLMLFQGVFLFPSAFGGEEGIVEVPGLAGGKVAHYYIALCATVGIMAIRWWAHRSRVGLLLRATGENETLARSSGIHTVRVHVALFACSAALGAVGGALYAHTHGQVNAELASSALSVHIVLLALVGGRGAGPLISVVLFFTLRRLMTGIVPGEAAVYAATLLAATVVFPAGMVGRRS